MKQIRTEPFPVSKVWFSSMFLLGEMILFEILLMDEILHLRFRKPCTCKSWDKVPISTGDRRISEPSTVSRWWQLKYFLCSPLPGEDSQFDEHIFQMGWFNHQPGMMW